MKETLREIRSRGACLPWSTAARLGLWQGNGAPVQFVIEQADWAIRWVGEHVRDEINCISPGTVETVVRPERIVNRVVHFGSQYMWLTWGSHMSSTNRYTVSFFHGKHEDGPQVSRHIDAFLTSVSRVARIVASATLVRDRLVSWGVDPDKISVIPIGCETDRFRPPTPEQRNAARERFGIRTDEIVIGSFQKDGEGWGSGDIPKLIKGPDVFLAAVERLAKDLPVFVLLGGPARGYVRRGLERLGIRHAYHYAPNRVELAKLYHPLDLYLVTSREEGGPMALMESMSSGIPVVSTRVGMAPDLIVDGKSGALVEVGDVDALTVRARELLALPDGGTGLRAAARKAVMVADWTVVARRHLNEVWRPLLDEPKADQEPNAHAMTTTERPTAPDLSPPSEEISGDIRLSVADRLRYLLRNACRNIAVLGRGPRSRAFRPDASRAAAIASGQSPGRLLTELFIEAELPLLTAPRELEVLEIGCGSGSMAFRLARLGFSGRYRGIDIKDRFRRDHPKDFPFAVSHVVSDAHTFRPPRPVDLLISVSTLEHIPHDSVLIRRLASLCNPGGLEVHVVPSGPSLALYLWHGFRQYTPAALAARFGPDVEIVRLGGLTSYLLHFAFGTVPDMIVHRSLRKTLPRLYRALLLASLRLDALLPIFPTAYAVIRRH